MGAKPLRHVTIHRDPDTSPYGTFGILNTDSGFECYTLERLATGDHPCIPSGEYTVAIRPHPKHGQVYEVLDVPGRTDILIHPANWVEQLLGCIALGNAVSSIEGTWNGTQINHQGLMSSRDAVIRFMNEMESEPFLLTIGYA